MPISLLTAAAAAAVFHEFQRDSCERRKFSEAPGEQAPGCEEERDSLSETDGGNGVGTG